MRGNRLARGGDPMKTRSQRRKERREKISQTNRAQRQKRRICRLVAQRCVREEGEHMTAIMQSYALRRKAERAAQRRAEEEKEAERKGQQQQQETRQKKGQEKDVQRGGQGAKRNGAAVVQDTRLQQRRPAAARVEPRDARLVRNRQPKVMTRSLY